MKKVVVTGGMGMIGRAIVDQLAGKYEIIVIDWFKDNVNINNKYKNVYYINEDIINTSKLEKYLNGSYALVHLAAAVHFKIKNKFEEEKIIEINYNATKRLFLLAKMLHINKAIFFSTTDVYTNKNQPIRENEEIMPLGVYGKSKYSAEMALKEIASKDDISIVILRPASAFGPGDRGSMYDLIRYAKKGFLPIIDGGVNIKALAYVKDIAEFVDVILEANQKFSAEVFNICTGNYTFLEIINTIKKVYGYKIFLINIPLRLLNSGIFPKSIKNRLEIIGSSKPISIEKAKEMFGFSAKYSLETALKDCASYYAKKDI